MDGSTKKRNEEYQQRVKEVVPNSPTAANCARAFLTGGVICAIGQFFNYAGRTWLMLDKDGTAAFTAIVMVFLGALLTGLGVYDKISSFGGAGAAVPITGFSNGIVSSAMEFKSEGYIMGLGAKMFTIAGPVLVYGTLTSCLVGLIYYFFVI